MYLPQRMPALLFTQLLIATSVTVQGLTVPPTWPTGAGPIALKELKMQPSPPDPKSQQKAKPPIPEMVGATSAPLELSKRVTTFSFEIHPPTGPALLRPDGQRRRIILRIENARSTTGAPNFDIYLNLPPAEEPEKRPDLHAFTMGTFGLVESSKTKDHHPGNGLSISQDVTDLFLRLTASRDWDPKSLRVSFVAGAWNTPFSVQVGRTSLMIE